MIDSQWFSVSMTPLMTAFGIFIVIAGVILCGVSLRRTGFKRSQCILETIRFLLLCTVAPAALVQTWAKTVATIPADMQAKQRCKATRSVSFLECTANV